MTTLDEYVRWGNEDIASLTARFLYSFIMNSSLLKTYEVDNFILRNGKVLCSWYVLLGYLWLALVTFTLQLVSGSFMKSVTLASRT